jgi:hypothetical protein
MIPLTSTRQGAQAIRLNTTLSIISQHRLNGLTVSLYVPVCAAAKPYWGSLNVAVLNFRDSFVSSCSTDLVAYTVKGGVRAVIPKIYMCRGTCGQNVDNINTCEFSTNLSIQPPTRPLSIFSTYSLQCPQSTDCLYLTPVSTPTCSSLLLMVVTLYVTKWMWRKPLTSINACSRVTMELFRMTAKFRSSSHPLTWRSFGSGLQGSLE